MSTIENYHRIAMRKWARMWRVDQHWNAKLAENSLRLAVFHRNLARAEK